MITAQVVETSVSVNNNSPIQDYVHPIFENIPTGNCRGSTEKKTKYHEKEPENHIKKRV